MVADDAGAGGGAVGAGEGAEAAAAEPCPITRLLNNPPPGAGTTGSYPCSGRRRRSATPNCRTTPIRICIGAVVSVALVYNLFNSGRCNTKLMTMK